MREILSGVFHLERPGLKMWSFEDFGIWRREQENYPDERFGRDPNSKTKREVFILGLVRNPFSYYRSLYIMLQDKYRLKHRRNKLYLRSNGTQGALSRTPCLIR